MRPATWLLLAAAWLAGCDRFQQKEPIPSHKSTTLEAVQAVNAEPPVPAASAPSAPMASSPTR